VLLLLLLMLARGQAALVLLVLVAVDDHARIIIVAWRDASRFFCVVQNEKHFFACPPFSSLPESNESLDASSAATARAVLSLMSCMVLVAAEEGPKAGRERRRREDGADRRCAPFAGA
jgi:hypothetical protein